MKRSLLLSALFISALIIFTGCKNDISEKQKVLSLLKSIETGDPKPAGYINPDKYIQHNLNAADGLAGFTELMKQIPPGSAKVNSVRIFKDGEYVVAHTEYNFFGPKIGFDIFRFENGKIVEHWDNLQERMPLNQSGHSMIDGVSKVSDIEKTAENKKIIKGFTEDVLQGKNPSKISEYISAKQYIQHNPGVKDGMNGLAEAIEKLQKAGMPLKYSKVHKILGEGNFVLVVAEGEFLKKHVAFYDLFRIENGKIVEHWDVVEEIPEKNKWKNKNGKF